MKAESVYTGTKTTGYSLLGYGPTSQARSTIRAGCGAGPALADRIHADARGVCHQVRHLTAHCVPCPRGVGGEPNAC